MSYNSGAYGQNYQTGGGESGGGFVDGGGSGGREQKAEQTLRPVTVRQALNAYESDGDWSIDGLPITQLTFVGLIRSVSSGQTNISYQVYDGTGVIEARQWVSSEDANDESAEPMELRVGTYVRILGVLKEFQRKKSVTAVSVRPLTDHNEYLCHQLMTIEAHNIITKGNSAGGRGGNTNGYANGDDNYGASGGAGQAPRYQDDARYAGLDAAAKRAFDIILRDALEDTGYEIRNLEGALRKSSEQVQVIVDDIIQSGLAYETDSGFVTPSL